MDSHNSINKSTPKMNSGYHLCSGMMRWDSLDSFILAITLIWAGSIFLSENLGFLLDTWSIFFLGAGTLVLIEITIRLLVQAYRSSIIGDLIWAGFLFWLGEWNIILPLVLVAIGVYMIHTHFYNHHIQINN
jgi:hypothetical protein